MRNLIHTLIAALVVILYTTPALAYVGPGPGLTVLGALWAVIAAVALAVWAIIRWPLRFIINKIRGNKTSKPEEAETPDPLKEVKDFKND